MLIQLLVMVIVAGILYWIVTLLPLPEPFKTIAIVIVILIILFWILGMVGMIPSPYFHPLTR